MGIGEEIAFMVVGGIFLGVILFLVFAQVTVRKLEKNPATKHELGVEFMSGQRIYHVAFALVLPLWYFRKARQNPMSIINANAELVRQYTNRFDKFLAYVFFWVSAISALGTIICAILTSLGVIKIK
jgi:small-conductance mechanosensitive channel